MHKSSVFYMNQQILNLVLYKKKPVSLSIYCDCDACVLRIFKQMLQKKRDFTKMFICDKINSNI